MPLLHGRPEKRKLYAQVHQLEAELAKERREHQKTRDQLRYAMCKVVALEAKIQRMEQKAREVLAEAAQEVEDETWERSAVAKNRERDAITKALLEDQCAPIHSIITKALIESVRAAPQ